MRMGCGWRLSISWGSGSFQLDTADEGFAFGIGPGAKFVEFVVFDQELSAAARADDRLLAIAPRFAPLDDIAERMTFA